MHPDPTPEDQYCLKFNRKVKSLVGTFDDKQRKCLGALLQSRPIDSRPGWARLPLEGSAYIDFSCEIVRGDYGENVIDNRSQLPLLYVASYREGDLRSDAKKTFYSALGWTGRLIGVISAAYGAWNFLEFFLAR